ncbi:MAG: 3-hydroxyacyl-CoA dehydrogenase [Rhizobiaceae bacterium]|nr:3-hydroxyacyl-CoA dehydrogenase [Rhizobiaceae bacterium]
MPVAEASVRKRTAGIVGAGSIGSAFAIVFAAAGHRVVVQDPAAASLENARTRVSTSLQELKQFDLLDEPAEDVAGRIAYVADLSQAVHEADFIQECAPERLELKQPLFTEIERHAKPDAIIASSASAIPASRSMGHLDTRHRCLVCHPGNPPYLIPVIEIVPAPFTDPNVAEQAQRFFAAAGMSPIMVRKEIEGFVFNRLQGALLREAYCLFRDGVASIEEIDSIVRDGLGMRWSFMGPFETVDLNTQGGLASHAQKMGPAYARMGKERGQDDPWTSDLVERATAERRSSLAIEDWQKRTEWRDRQLMALLRHRRRLAVNQNNSTTAQAAK